jgi:hypothetical protein
MSFKITAVRYVGISRYVHFSYYCLSVLYRLQNQRALTPQIGCGTTIAQKNLKKKFTENFLNFFYGEICFGDFFYKIFP